MIKIKSLENNKVYIIFSMQEYCFLFSNPQRSLKFHKNINLTFNRILISFFYKIYYRICHFLKYPSEKLSKIYYKIKFLNLIKSKTNITLAVHWNATLQSISDGFEYFNFHYCAKSSDPFNLLPSKKRIFITSRDFVKFENEISLEKNFDFTFIGNPSFNKNTYNFLSAAKILYEKKFFNLKTCTLFPCNFNDLLPPPNIDFRLLINEDKHLNEFPFNNRIFLNKKMTYPGLSRNLISIIIRSSKYIVLFSDEEGEPRIITEAHALKVPTVVNKAMYGSVHDSCKENINTIYSSNSKIPNIVKALEVALEKNIQIKDNVNSIYKKKLKQFSENILKNLNVSNNQNNKQNSLINLLSRLELIHVFAGHALSKNIYKNKEFIIETINCRRRKDIINNLKNL